MWWGWWGTTLTRFWRETPSSMIWTTGSRYEVAILHTAASTLQSQQPPGHQHGVPAVVTEAEEEDVVAVSCVTRWLCSTVWWWWCLSGTSRWRSAWQVWGWRSWSSSSSSSTSLSGVTIAQVWLAKILKAPVSFDLCIGFLISCLLKVFCSPLSLVS